MLPKPSECTWVDPSVRPYSTFERMLLRQLDIALHNLAARDLALPLTVDPLAPIPPAAAPVVLPAPRPMITTRRHHPSRKVFRHV